MRTKFSISFLLALVLFTIILPNHQYLSRIKASLTVSELEISSGENNDVGLLPMSQTMALLAQIKFEHSSLKLSEVILNPAIKIFNPSLNRLYRAHSPPSHS